MPVDMPRVNDDPARGLVHRQDMVNGRHAAPGTTCPFGEIQLGKRCAWLAGHYDAHGREAWEQARLGNLRG